MTNFRIFYYCKRLMNETLVIPTTILNISDRLFFYGRKYDIHRGGGLIEVLS